MYLIKGLNSISYGGIKMERYSYLTFKNLIKLIGTIFIMWVLWIIFVLNGEELLGHGFKEFSIIFISILLTALPFMLLVSFIAAVIQVFFGESIISKKIFRNRKVLQYNNQSSKISEVLQETTYKFMLIGRYLIFGALIYSYLHFWQF